MINPYQRTRQVAVFDSIQWLKQSNCTAVASTGLWPDYLYLTALAPIKYTGEIVKPSDIALQKSTQLEVTCVAVATDSPNFEAFRTNPGYRELYHNNMIWIFLITRYVDSS